MTDPVIANDGRTYERSAITQWISTSSRSPFTNQPLTLSSLTPNRALKDAIDAWKDANPGVSVTPLPRAIVPVNDLVESEVLPSSSSSTMPPPISTDDALDQPTVAVELTSSGAMLVTVLPPKRDIPATERCHVHLMCVIDVSGSMDTAATARNDDGKLETFALSTLDIVKHATRTMSLVLGENDFLSIITYSDDAKTLLPPTLMSTAGREQVDTILQAMRTEGSTNIWAGLQEALRLSKKHSNPNVVEIICLLTDGQPNRSPAIGEAASLRKYKNANPDHPFTLATMAFGFNAIDSRLLTELATIGNGPYGYIPDASFVGTIFVNLVSNILSAAAKDVKVHITSSKSGPLMIHGGYENSLMGSKKRESGEEKGELAEDGTTSSCMIDIGLLRYGQSKSILVSMGDVPIDDETIQVTVELTGTGGRVSRSTKITKTLTREDAVTSGSDLFEAQKIRSLVVDQIEKALRKGNDGTVIMNELVKTMKDLSSARSTIATSISGLLTDVAGEGVIAFEKANFEKWGLHYLQSLRSAHKREECNNFKDPGVQVYGEGKLFNDIRDVANEIFDNLPAPKPTVSRSTSASTTSSSTVSMARLNYAQGGCIHGECLARLASSSSVIIEKAVKDLKRGDSIMTGSGKVAVIKCVIKMECENSQADLVVFNSGLKLTPYHPVLINNTWTFPINNVSKSSEARYELDVDCDFVYSFVLDSPEESSIVINNIPCITLGHGITGDPVASHPYLGTSKITDEFSTMPGWNVGFLQFRPNPLLRGPSIDGTTPGLVCGFDRKKLVL